MDPLLYTFALSGLFNAGVSILYGCYVIIKSKRTQVAQLYFLMSMAIAVWGIGYWQWLLASTPDEAIFWLRVLTIGSLFIPAFYLHWVFSLLNVKTLFSNSLLLSTYLISLIGVILIRTPFLVESVVNKAIFPYWPDAGILYGPTIFLLYFLAVVVALFHIFSAYIAATTKTQKMLYLSLMVGSVIGFVGGATNFALWYDLPLLPYGTFLVAIFPIVFGYSSFRHRLFNIRVISSEILVLVIVGIMLFQLILSNSIGEVLLRAFLFLLVSVLAYMVIKNTYHEIESREKGERLARYLANANARLRELDRQKTEFVSIASHQLRGPIAAIVGYTSLMKDGSYGPVPDNLNVPVSRIFESGKRISIMVDDFLNVTRIEQGRMAYNLRPCDLGSMVSKVVEEMRVIAEQRGLSISYETNIGEPVYVDADESKLMQVFQNLVDNAIKYTVEGSVSVSMHLAQDSERVLIVIRDTGIGIAPEELHNLFQKFNRASNANTVSVYGAGLGLYIAREMIKAHQGWIHISSAGVGKGTTFTVELPVHDGPAEKSQQ